MIFTFTLITHKCSYAITDTDFHRPFEKDKFSNKAFYNKLLMFYITPTILTLWASQGKKFQNIKQYKYYEHNT